MATAKKRSNQPLPPDALEQRVDAMMDPKKPDVPLAAPVVQDGTPPPIDIFSDPKTAPQVPNDLLKRLKTPNRSPVTKRSISVSHDTDDITVPVASQTAPPLTKTPKPSPQPVTPVAAPVTTEPTPTEPEMTASEWVGPRTASQPPAINLEDTSLDAAVADIASHEGDELLAAQDAVIKTKSSDVPKKPTKRRLHLNLGPKKWLLLAVAVILVLGVAAWPTSRYKLLGLAIRKQVTVQVIDATNNTPVTDSSLLIAGKKVTTDASGKAQVSVAVGKQTLTSSKQYYQTLKQDIFVGLSGQPSATVHLIATGRQVPITVENSITLQPLANAQIKVLNTTARTDAFGKATIVLPAKSGKDPATVSLSGYNTFKTSVTVTSTKVSANTFSLTPAGHVYFLSNSSGTIDVMQANLDGGGRKTILAGTGHESASTTQLLASGDWQYLVLKAARDSSGTGLYLIDTSTGKATEFDASNSTFTLVGWSGDNIVYDAVKAATPASTNGHEVLKSYDALHSQLNQLDASTATGTTSDYAYSSFGNFNLIDNQLFYTSQWYVSGNGDDSTKSDTIRGLTVGGAAAKDYESVPTATFGYWQSVQTGPEAVSFAAFDSSDNKSTYYKLANGSVVLDSAGSNAVFNQDYPHYYASPDKSKTFWSVLRDGQNTLFTAGTSGQSQKEVPTNGSFKAYGWYGSNYLIISKNGNQLYTIAVNGTGAPYKIGSYYQPSSLVSVSNYQVP